MISWMQRHKKWLIVTIWISTIAFVGAGFVGWGSYDYGKSNSAVAIVGDREVPFSELQNEYNTLYGQYQQMFGESFNKELAQQLKLEDAALQRVIQKNLLLNYATDLGLMTTDKEVARELIKIDSFFKDGKFDKNTYISVLKQNRRTSKEFEAQLKQDLLISKVQNIFNLPLNKNEIKNISELVYSQSKVSIAILNSDSSTITPTSNELKKHWEQTKDNYKTLKGYKIQYTKVKNVENKTKKEMRKIALKLYLKLKKDDVKFEVTKTMDKSSTFLSNENFSNIIKSSTNETLKPLYDGENYYVFKLASTVSPKVLDYNIVKSEIKNDFLNIAKIKQLETKVQKSILNFKGKDIGYISRDSKVEISGLSTQEIEQLVNNIFASKENIASIQLGNKAVVYKITDSKLGIYDSLNDAQIISIASNLKTNLISSSLLEKLNNKYEVNSFTGNK